MNASLIEVMIFLYWPSDDMKRYYLSTSDVTDMADISVQIFFWRSWEKFESNMCASDGG